LSRNGHSRLRRATAFLAAAFFIGAPGAASAAENFYKLNDRWEKAQSSGLTKQEAVDSGFAAALANPPQRIQGPVSLPIRRNLVQLAQQHIDLEINQSLVVTANGLVKFFSTTDGVVAMQTLDTNTLQVVGTHFGNTFVHVYDAAGRTTFEVQCIPPTYTLTTSQIRKVEEAEKTRSFHVGYAAGRGAFYTGDTFSQRNRTSMDLDQTFSLAGDTPHGYLTSYMSTQRGAAKNLIIDEQVALKDGKIGPWRDFDAYGGDSSVFNGLMAFPEARIRGVQIDQRLNENKTNAKVFYGREKFGIIGSLTPGLTTKRNITSFLGGGTVEHHFDKVSKVKVGYFNGHGRARRDELNKHAEGVKADIGLGPHVVYSPEADFDNEHFAEKQALKYHSENLTVRGEFRDISKSFVTMIGTPAQQGELGYRLDVESALTENLNVGGALDVFRDRLIPNPDAPHRYNAHRDLTLSWAIDKLTAMQLGYQDLDDTGRLGPTKQKTVSGQLNRSFDPFDHRIVLYGRWQNRGYRNLLSSDANYVVDQIIVGAQTALLFGVSFTIDQEFNFLREPNIDEHSMPHATTYSLDWSHQVEKTPFSVNARFRYRDEEETEAVNSFMSGEDRTDLSLGLYYREQEDREFFVTGRISNSRPENPRVLAPRVEAELLTGVRYDWDTGFSWSTVGAFDGFVYKDLNGDGKRDENEPGIAGVTIAAGQIRAVTDEKGFYELKGVPGRRVSLAVDTSQLPYGFTPTSSSVLEVDILEGKAQQVDFGASPRSEVAGIVFNDLDGNGKYDLTDRGVSKVSLMLENGKIERTKVSGAYFFSGVLAGPHTVKLDLGSVPSGYLPAGEMKKTVTVFEGMRYEQNFPLKAIRAVSGRVFIDTNDNKNLDGDEIGAPDVVVLVGGVPAVTDAEGYYLFEDLQPGTNTLELDPKTLPPGMSATSAPIIEMPEEPKTLTEKNVSLSKKAADQRVTDV